MDQGDILRLNEKIRAKFKSIWQFAKWVLLTFALKIQNRKTIWIGCDGVGGFPRLAPEIHQLFLQTISKERQDNNNWFDIFEYIEFCWSSIKRKFSSSEWGANVHKSKNYFLLQQFRTISVEKFLLNWLFRSNDDSILLFAKWIRFNIVTGELQQHSTRSPNHIGLGHFEHNNYYESI